MKINNFEKMVILIVGSKGFIGEHCIKYFSKSGYHVYGCDVVTDYSAENYFLIDATNADYQSIFKINIFDVCINCSGAAEVSASIMNPFRDYTLNVNNVYKILDAIRTYQPKCKFINLSSAAVYGNPKYLPIDEMHPLNPISPYGYHKVAAENICTEFHKIFGIETCNLRIFSVFGAGLKKQLFWDLYKKTKEKKEIELFGSGNESRDFIYVDDLINAIELIIQYGKYSNTVINVANGNEINIKDVARLFLGYYNENKKYQFSGISKVGDPVNWQADISILKSLGYLQKVTFEQGIIKYVEWIKELE